MAAAYQQALGLLPKLSHEERRKLRVVLEQLPGSAASRSANASSSIKDDWLFDGIVKELSRRGLVYRTKDTTTIRRIAPSYEHDSLFVRATLEKALKKSLPDYRQAHLVALGLTSARCLANYLAPVRTLGLKFLLVNTSKTFEAIDRSFPSYIQAGMIRVLVQKDRL